MSCIIDLQIATQQQNIPTLTQFDRWVRAALPDTLSQVELTIRLVDVTESAELNETYRHKSGPTNILSFNYDAMPGISQNSLGDLAICAQRVEEEAVAQHKTLKSHFAHLTIHGILHLLGYDHINNDDAITMETLEIKILKELNIENPYN